MEVRKQGYFSPPEGKKNKKEGMKVMKKLGFALLIVLVFSAFAFANPFVDVPADHWAYDAVQSLAAKGIIVGYPDGTFGGNRTMTRYEFAEAIAKALAYVEQKGYVTKDDLAVLEKLSVEFAEELSTLGVTVDDLKAALGENSKAIKALQADVEKLNKYFEPIKVTGSSTVEYSAQVLPTWANATLTDSTALNFAVDINDTTKLKVELTVDDVISGSPVVSADAFCLKWDDGESYLKASNSIDDLGSMGELGLIYDSGYNDDEYAGLAAKWSWLDATWRFGAEVDKWYTVNADWGDLGVTFSYDVAASDLVAGADLSWKFIDTEDTQATLKVEGGYAINAGAFGVAGKVDLTTGDLTLALDGHYIAAGFAPTAGGFDADTIGFGADASYPLADDLALSVSYDYEMTASTSAVTTNEANALLVYTVDADAGEKAGVNFTYDMVAGGFTLYVGYLNYPAFDKTTVSAAYQFDSAAGEHAAKATVAYKFDDSLTGKLEGRVDTVPAAGAPIWSAEVSLVKTLAENTTLTLGYEQNAWSEDLGDYGSFDTMGNIDDGNGTVSMSLEVTF